MGVTHTGVVGDECMMEGCVCITSPSLLSLFSPLLYPSGCLFIYHIISHFFLSVIHLPPSPSLFPVPVSYENSEIALNCGMMLRECVRHEPLCKIILNSEKFYNFFGFVEVSTFDIASDAFATFKVCSPLVCFILSAYCVHYVMVEEG